MDQGLPTPWTLDGSRCPSFIQSHLGSGMGVTFPPGICAEAAAVFSRSRLDGCCREQAVFPGSIVCANRQLGGAVHGRLGASYVGRWPPNGRPCILSVPCNHPFT